MFFLCQKAATQLEETLDKEGDGARARPIFQGLLPFVGIIEGRGAKEGGCVGRVGIIEVSVEKGLWS